MDGLAADIGPELWPESTDVSLLRISNLCESAQSKAASELHTLELWKAWLLEK